MSRALAIAAVAAAALAMTARAEEAEGRVFALVNDRAEPVRHLAFGPVASSERWRNLLGRTGLAPGSWAEAPVDAALGCRYDVMAVTASGAQYFALNVDVCAAEELRLSTLFLAPPPVAERGPGGRRRFGAARGPAPVERGLPLCPGDPRCRKKK